MANTIICDSDYDMDLTILNDDGSVKDITNCTFEFLCVREQNTIGNCGRIFLSNGNGLSLQDPTNGVLRISFTAAQTKDFGPGVGRVLLWRTDDGRRVVGEGSATFEGKKFDA